MNFSKSFSRIVLLLGMLLQINSFAEVIDEVKVDGVPIEWNEAIKAIGSFLPGDETNQTKLNRSLTRIKEYVENKGYPAADVDTEVTYRMEEKQRRSVLNFHVTLGEPIRIQSVTYRFLNGNLTPEQQARLTLVLDFKQNEPYDRDRIKEMRRSVESTLAVMSFVDSRVSKVDTESSGKSLVKLVLEVELGQRVAFSVQGNEFFARSELMTMIEEQRLLGLGRDYVQVLYNRIRDQYVEHGFRAVQIVDYSFESKGDEPRKILFVIKEGPRSKIKSVTFDGNEAFSSPELEKLFFKNAADRIQGRIYNEKMAEDAAKGMIEEIRRKGYLSAKLIAFKTEELNDRAELAIRIFVNEGLQSKVHSIQFRGATVFTEEQLTSFLGLEENQPMNLVQLEDGVERVKREYRNEGYLNMVFTNEATNQIVAYSEKNQIADLSFDVNEGTRYVLSEIKIFGNEKTASSVIRREAQVEPGEIIRENKIAETEDKLRRLGIFSQVALELQDVPEDSQKKLLKITVQEGIPGNLGFGMGYRNDLGIRVFGDLTYANLWGQNHAWVLNVSTNRRLENYRFFEYTAQMSYIWPWFALGETTFRPSLNAEKRQYLKFDAETFGFSSNFDRSLWKRLGLAGGVTYTLEQVRQFNAKDSTDNQQIRIGSITPNLRVDLRDNPLMPRRGFFASTSYEYAHPVLGGQGEPVPVNYGRFQVRTDYYVDKIPNIVWYTSLRGGWVRNFAPASGDSVYDKQIKVPLIKQFALGGVNSLRGYRDQEINVQDYDIKGYLTFTNYRTQFDYFVTQNLSFGPFLDAGNLNIDSFSIRNMKFGAGVGLRYVTPVGPVNFDWGRKMFTNEGGNAFYFSLGVI